MECYIFSWFSGLAYHREVSRSKDYLTTLYLFTLLVTIVEKSTIVICCHTITRKTDGYFQVSYTNTESISANED